MNDIYDELYDCFKADKALQNAISAKDSQWMSEVIQHRQNMSWHMLDFKTTYITVHPDNDLDKRRLCILLDLDLNINKIIKE